MRPARLGLIRFGRPFEAVQQPLAGRVKAENVRAKAKPRAACLPPGHHLTENALLSREVQGLAIGLSSSAGTGPTPVGEDPGPHT